MALELRDGHVVYKFDLGSGTTELRSDAAYNDGMWHQLRAAQLQMDADLTVRAATGTSRKRGCRAFIL